MEVLNFSSKRGQNEIYSDFAEREKIQGLKNLNVPNLRFPEFKGVWKDSNIGRCFDLYSGNTPSRMEKEHFIGDVNWITSGELKEHYIGDTKERISEKAAADNNLRILPIGTFVMAIYGLEAEGVRGTCSITVKTSTISQACMAFTPKSNVSNEFLYSWYKKHGNKIGIRYAQGTKQQNLSYDIIEKFPIIYPSIEEQEKLNTFISLLDERIATQNKIIQQLQSLIKGIYDKVFEDISNYQKLSSICTIQKGQQVNGEELSELGDFYVMNGGIEPSGYYDRYNTDANTISISEGGNSCGYVKYNNVPFWSGGHCYTLQSITKDYNNLFLFHYLKAKEKEIMALRIGSGLPNIQKKDLGKFIVPILPLEMQIGIVDGINKIETKLKQEKDILSAYQKQKAYLLKNLFI